MKKKCQEAKNTEISILIKDIYYRVVWSYYVLPSPIAVRLQVLTRRDQLKLKETIKEEKGEKKTGKSAKTETEKAEDGQGPGGDQKEKPTKRQPKTKAKSKAKAKAKAGGSAGDGEEPVERDPSPEVEFTTPKKRLFEDEPPIDEPPIDPSPGKLPCIDPKTGKVTTVRELLNVYHPDLFEDEPQIASKGLGTKTIEPPEPEIEKPQAKAKAKAKAKGKAKAKASPKPKPKAKAKASPKKKKTEISSPSIKKEQNRRKKNTEKKDANMYQCESAEDMSDPVMQGVLREHIKNLRTFSRPNIRDYLYKTLPNKFKSGAVVAYWTRPTPSCGVTIYKDQSNPTATKQHFGYFSFKIAKDWNTNMGVAYVCAHLMASWLKAGDGLVGLG